MKKTDSAHLIPALIFGGLLGLMLLASGASPGDTLLTLCVTYGIVSLVELVFDAGTAPSAEQKP